MEHDGLPDRRRSCTRKKAYGSEAEAWRIARKVNEKQKLTLHAYGCLFCGQWHIGRRLKRG